MVFVKDLSKYNLSKNVCIIICHLMADPPFPLCNILPYFFNIDDLICEQPLTMPFQLWLFMASSISAIKIEDYYYFPLGYNLAYNYIKELWTFENQHYYAVQSYHSVNAIMECNCYVCGKSFSSDLRFSNHILNSH